jgi:hypothetical protein
VTLTAARKAGWNVITIERATEMPLAEILQRIRHQLSEAINLADHARSRRRSWPSRRIADYASLANASASVRYVRSGSGGRGAVSPSLWADVVG